MLCSFFWSPSLIHWILTYRPLLVSVIISVYGYLQALALARVIRVSALRAAPQGLWDEGQQVTDSSASSSS